MNKSPDRPNQKVIIPKGTVKQNETAVIEIPFEFQNEPVVVVKAKTLTSTKSCPGSKNSIGASLGLVHTENLCNASDGGQSNAGFNGVRSCSSCGNQTCVTSISNQIGSTPKAFKKVTKTIITALPTDDNSESDTLDSYNCIDTNPSNTTPPTVYKKVVTTTVTEGPDGKVSTTTTTTTTSNKDLCNIMQPKKTRRKSQEKTDKTDSKEDDKKRSNTDDNSGYRSDMSNLGISSDTSPDGSQKIVIASENNKEENLNTPKPDEENTSSTVNNQASPKPAKPIASSTPRTSEEKATLEKAKRLSSTAGNNKTKKKCNDPNCAANDKAEVRSFKRVIKKTTTTKSAMENAMELLNACQMKSELGTCEDGSGIIGNSFISCNKAKPNTETTCPSNIQGRSGTPSNRQTNEGFVSVPCVTNMDSTITYPHTINNTSGICPTNSRGNSGILQFIQTSDGFVSVPCVDNTSINPNATCPGVVKNTSGLCSNPNQNNLTQFSQISNFKPCAESTRILPGQGNQGVGAIQSGFSPCNLGKTQPSQISNAHQSCLGAMQFGQVSLNSTPCQSYITCPVTNQVSRGGIQPINNVCGSCGGSVLITCTNPSIPCGDIDQSNLEYVKRGLTSASFASQNINGQNILGCVQPSQMYSVTPARNLTDYNFNDSNVGITNQKQIDAGLETNQGNARTIQQGQIFDDQNNSVFITPAQMGTNGYMEQGNLKVMPLNQTSVNLEVSTVDALQQQNSPIMGDISGKTQPITSGADNNQQYNSFLSNQNYAQPVIRNCYAASADQASLGMTQMQPPNLEALQLNMNSFPNSSISGLKHPTPGYRRIIKTTTVTKASNSNMRLIPPDQLESTVGANVSTSYTSSYSSPGYRKVTKTTTITKTPINDNRLGLRQPGQINNYSLYSNNPNSPRNATNFQQISNAGKTSNLKSNTLSSSSGSSSHASGCSKEIGKGLGVSHSETNSNLRVLSGDAVNTSDYYQGSWEPKRSKDSWRREHSSVYNLLSENTLGTSSLNHHYSSDQARTERKPSENIDNKFGLIPPRHLGENILVNKSLGVSNPFQLQRPYQFTNPVRNLEHFIKRINNPLSQTAKTRSGFINNSKNLDFHLCNTSQMCSDATWKNTQAGRRLAQTIDQQLKSAETAEQKDLEDNLKNYQQTRRKLVTNTSKISGLKKYQ